MSDRSPDETLSTEEEIALLEFIESEEDEPQPEWEFICGSSSDTEEDYDWASEEPID
jgi:hypothetical protein